jgi:hypothetical protein
MNRHRRTRQRSCSEDPSGASRRSVPWGRHDPPPRASGTVSEGTGPGTAAALEVPVTPPAPERTNALPELLAEVLEPQELSRAENLKQRILLLAEELRLLEPELGHARHQLARLRLVVCATAQEGLHLAARGLLLLEELATTTLEVLHDPSELLGLRGVQSEPLLHHAAHLGTDASLELLAVRRPPIPRGRLLRFDAPLPAHQAEDEHEEHGAGGLPARPQARAHAGDHAAPPG